MTPVPVDVSVLPDNTGIPHQLISPHAPIQIDTNPNIQSSVETPPSKLRGIGLHANQELMALPPAITEKHETQLMSSHTTPGLPAWQSGPKFIPITPTPI